MLDNVEPEGVECVYLAQRLLEICRGSERLGLQGLDIKAFTPHEFELMNYFSSQINRFAQKG